MAWKYYIAPKSELLRMTQAGLPRGRHDGSRRRFDILKNPNGPMHAIAMQDNEWTNSELDRFVAKGWWSAGDRSAVLNGRVTPPAGQWDPDLDE